MSVNFILWVCSLLEEIAKIDAKNLREISVRELIGKLKGEYSKEPNCRIVCATLEPVAKNGLKLEEAIRTLRYWSMYD